ncbi:hypothetical protein GWI33_013024 [Rhynchophorus ferrugineus]|uniref:Uncharacterized protein n=1 Tax=Rhynchophorus ferrugineus TaxID=354439 RepID=A0A834I483_RHYFE|nr:hypothetical protein GWI33_013024 [Rhynchophorus ferrugineus]
MYGNNQRDDSSPPAHFSVHAEFTITHPGADDPRNRPRTSMERDEATGGVRMTYTWQPEWAGREGSLDPTSEGKRTDTGAWSPTVTNSNKSIYSDTHSSATLTPPRSVPPQILPPSAVFGTPYTRGYQKGNIFFTSTPPQHKEDDERPIQNIPRDPRLHLMQDAARVGLIHDSSGYGSDLLSPHSQGSSSTFPRRNLQPYDRRCRSTCNITLTTNVSGNTPTGVNMPCNRSRSLRCQTPASSVLRGNVAPSGFYGCGDPWCHHSGQIDELPQATKITPVQEEWRNSPHDFSLPSSSSDLISNKKDACVQTFEMVDKCTSPFLRMNSTDSMDSKNNRKYQKRGMTEPIWRKHSPGGSFTPDSLDSVKPPSTVHSSRSPKPKRHSLVDSFRQAVREPAKEQSPADSKSTDPLKKPRTVHIDVYCTGTELESDASSGDESRSKSASTPQTVFENEKMKVTHKKANEHELPFYLKNRLLEKSDSAGRLLKKSPETGDQEDSDDDAVSSAYPSKVSSYSTIGDYSASMSSVPRSWTTYSMSSCAIPDEYDSIANTSWKDTFSDIESLLQSRSSLAATESLDFVPRKLYDKNESIDETPEYLSDRKGLLETPSIASLQPSDSFEYANSEDKMRIRQMEEKWKNKSHGRGYKSPINEKTLQVQQQRMQEYMDRKIKDKKNWESKESDSNDSDDSGKGWTFVKGPHKRDTVLRRPSKEEDTPKTTSPSGTLPTTSSPAANLPNISSPANMLPNTVRQAFMKSLMYQTTSDPLLVSPTTLETQKAPETSKKKPTPLKKTSPKDSYEQGSLSDSSPTSRSPSYVATKQRLSLDPKLRSPFMIVPGIYTEPRSIARKFGTVVSVMKKPGHHIGPAKNPDCLCDHCQSYWDSYEGYRNRTRSVGDPPSGKYVTNWREFLENGKESVRASDEQQLPFTDF